MYSFSSIYNKENKTIYQQSSTTLVADIIFCSHSSIYSLQDDVNDSVHVADVHLTVAVHVSAPVG